MKSDTIPKRVAVRGKHGAEVNQNQDRNSYTGRQNPQTQQATQPRRPLTDEERRRLEAARQAARQSGGASGEELRRRRMEQQYLNDNQPGTVNPRPQGTAPRNRQEEYYREYHNYQARRKKKATANVGRVVGIVLFFALIVGIISLSAAQIAKNDAILEQAGSETGGIPDRYQNDDLSGESDTTEETPAVTETEEPEKEPETFLPLTVDNTMLDKGLLVLVNYQYFYDETDNLTLKNAYTDRTGKLKVAKTDIGMTVEAFGALEAMVVALQEDTGCDDLLINSGHRTMDDQQRIWDSYMATEGEEYTRKYVAVPGYSEHQTGLACDLSFYTDDGLVVPIASHEFGSWLNAHCAEHGFIHRYPDDKVDITKIGYEAWHFRYVGEAHARAIMRASLCLEEYIDLLKDYTMETKLLYIAENGAMSDVELTAVPTEGGWLTYYVPKAEGEQTEILLFNGEVYSEYTVSGNNADGFVITVDLPGPAEPEGEIASESAEENPAA